MPNPEDTGVLEYLATAVHLDAAGYRDKAAVLRSMAQAEPVAKKLRKRLLDLSRQFAGDMTDFEHPPGSPEALAQGCTCPPQAGPVAPIVRADGCPGYECDWRCPIHGIEFAGQTPAEEQDNEPIRH